MKDVRHLHYTQAHEDKWAHIPSDSGRLWSWRKQTGRKQTQLIFLGQSVHGGKGTVEKGESSAKVKTKRTQNSPCQIIVGHLVFWR